MDNWITFEERFERRRAELEARHAAYVEQSQRRGDFMVYCIAWFCLIASALTSAWMTPHIVAPYVSAVMLLASSYAMGALYRAKGRV
jgi:hypothetical protein